VKHLKKNVSDNYVDYEIDSAIDMLFPNVYAQKLGTDPMPKIVETNNELQTFIYGRPKLNDEVNPDPTKSKQKPADQEKEPMGLDMMVMRKTKDAQDDSMLSEMLGVENLLFILNQTGANTNYIKDYYYGKENDKHREKPNYQYKEVKKIQTKRVNDLLQPKKDDILSKKKYSEVGKGNAKEKYEKALSVAIDSVKKLKEQIEIIENLNKSFDDKSYSDYKNDDNVKSYKNIFIADPTKDKNEKHEQTIYYYIFNIHQLLKFHRYYLEKIPNKNDKEHKLNNVASTLNNAHKLGTELANECYNIFKNGIESTKSDKELIKAGQELLDKIKKESEKLSALIEVAINQFKVDEYTIDNMSNQNSELFKKIMRQHLDAYIKADQLIDKALTDAEINIKATEKYLEVKDPVLPTAT
jgi:hypothetical protein